MSLIDTVRAERLPAWYLRHRRPARRTVPAWWLVVSAAGLLALFVILVLALPIWGPWHAWRTPRARRMRRQIWRVVLTTLRDLPHLRPALYRLWLSYLALPHDMRWIVALCSAGTFFALTTTLTVLL